jgi:hypothetical protein
MIENPKHNQAKLAKKVAYKEARNQGKSVYEAALAGDAAYDAVMSGDRFAEELRSYNSSYVWSLRQREK